MLEIDIEHAWPDFHLRIALSVGPEMLVLLGPSGAGKSLTLRAIAGLFRPKAGRIILRGRVLVDSHAGIYLPPEARRVGYVPQSYALFPHLSVFENVAYGLRGLTPSEVRARVSQLLQLVGLESLAERRPHQLSGGQQQRVALARALAIRPDVLLLDEPLAALDAPTRRELRKVLRDIQQSFQIPTLFVTHDLSEAMFLADRVGVMEAGSLLQIGPVGELLARPAYVRVAQLTGVRNILPARVEAVGQNDVLVRVGQRTLVARSRPEHWPLSVGESVYACIRGERVTLVLPERSGAPRANVARGEVIAEYGDGGVAVLLFRVHEPRLAPERDYDLEIEVPMYVYERLGLASRRAWTISIGSDALHLLPVGRDGLASLRDRSGVAGHTTGR